MRSSPARAFASDGRFAESDDLKDCESKALR